MLYLSCKKVNGDAKSAKKPETTSIECITQLWQYLQTQPCALYSILPWRPLTGGHRVWHGNSPPPSPHGVRCVAAESKLADMGVDLDHTMAEIVSLEERKAALMEELTTVDHQLFKAKSSWVSLGFRASMSGGQRSWKSTPRWTMLRPLSKATSGWVHAAQHPSFSQAELGSGLHYALALVLPSFRSYCHMPHHEPFHNLHTEGKTLLIESHL